MGGLVGEERRGARERRAHARVEARLEIWQQLVPDAVAPVGGVEVRRVLPPREPSLAQVVQDLLSGHREQRAHDVARPRPHSGKAGRPRPSQEPEQQRLRLVVPGVRDRDDGSPLLRGHAAEEREALAAGGLLNPPLLPRGPAADVRPAGAQGHVERPAQLGAEGRVLRGARPQAVIEVGGHEAQAAPPAQRGERVGESHRVGPARQAHHDRRPGRNGPGGPEGPIDGRDEGRQPHESGLLMKGGLVAVQGFEPRTPRI